MKKIEMNCVGWCAMFDYYYKIIITKDTMMVWKVLKIKRERKEKWSEQDKLLLKLLQYKINWVTVWAIILIIIELPIRSIGNLCGNK